MSKRGEEVFLQTSEILIFNKIGEYSKSNGYEVVYFKVEASKYRDDIKHDYYIHFVHLVKDGDVRFSIYYDEFNLTSKLLDYSYYELFDGYDAKRFGICEEEEIRLYDEIKQVI